MSERNVCCFWPIRSKCDLLCPPECHFSMIDNPTTHHSGQRVLQPSPGQPRRMLMFHQDQNNRSQSANQHAKMRHHLQPLFFFLNSSESSSFWELSFTEEASMITGEGERKTFRKISQMCVPPHFCQILHQWPKLALHPGHKVTAMAVNKHTQHLDRQQSVHHHLHTLITTSCTLPDHCQLHPS